MLCLGENSSTGLADENVKAGMRLGAMHVVPPGREDLHLLVSSPTNLFGSTGVGGMSYFPAAEAAVDEMSRLLLGIIQLGAAQLIALSLLAWVTWSIYVYAASPLRRYPGPYLAGLNAILGESQLRRIAVAVSLSHWPSPTPANAAVL